MGNRFKIGMLLTFFVIVIVLAITQLFMYIQFKQLNADVIKLTTELNEIPGVLYAPPAEVIETATPTDTPETTLTPELD